MTDATQFRQLSLPWWQCRAILQPLLEAGQFTVDSLCSVLTAPLRQSRGRCSATPCNATGQSRQPVPVTRVILIDKTIVELGGSRVRDPGPLVDVYWMHRSAATIFLVLW